MIEPIANGMEEGGSLDHSRETAKYSSMEGRDKVETKVVPLEYDVVVSS